MDVFTCSMHNREYIGNECDICARDRLIARQSLDAITLKERTLCHIRGMPFWLEPGTVIRGREANLTPEPHIFDPDVGSKRDRGTEGGDRNG